MSTSLTEVNFTGRCSRQRDTDGTSTTANGNGGGNSLNLEPSTFGSLQPRSAWLVLRGSRSGMNLIFFCLIFDERVALFLILLPLPSELSHRASKASHGRHEHRCKYASTVHCVLATACKLYLGVNCEKFVPANALSCMVPM